MPGGEITVCICTFRRYDLLTAALRSLQSQSMDPSSFDVLVIDNTPERERQPILLPAHPGWRVAHTAPPGLSRARNFGLEQCRTRYIAFIDDDAEASPLWVEGILAGFARHDAACVGGSIEPIWPGPRPEWIPKRFESALTILDLGRADRPLAKLEYLYGTNIAFETAKLRAIGGFDVALGRQGTSLLSSEETVVQDRLRADGMTVFYLADAAMRHRVHAERLSQAWFRKRFAWEAFSDCATIVADPDSNWVSWEFRQLLAKHPALARMARQLTDDHDDPDIVAEQLMSVRTLFAHLLAWGELRAENEYVVNPRSQAMRAFEVSPAAVPASRNSPTGASGDAQCLAAAACRIADAEYIFVDWKNSHEFLFDLYGEIPGSCFLEIPISPWENSSRARERVGRFLHTLFAHARRRRRTIVFLTIDPFFFPTYAALLRECIGQGGVKVFGLLHKYFFFSDPAVRSNLQALARDISIISPLGASADQIRALLGIRNIHFIEFQNFHRSWNEARRLRAREYLGCRSEDVVVGFLGEFRQGKGIEKILAALPHLSESNRKSALFLFAGRGDDKLRAEVGRVCTAGGIRALNHIRDGRTYRVLSDSEMDGMIAVTDIGLFPYHGEQAVTMSGIVPSLIDDRKQVLASEESYVGRLTQAHDLGFTFDPDQPRSFDIALGKAIGRRRRGAVSSLAEAYRETCQPQAIINRLRSILDDEMEMQPPCPTK